MRITNKLCTRIHTSARARTHTYVCVCVYVFMCVHACVCVHARARVNELTSLSQHPAAETVRSSTNLLRLFSKINYLCYDDIYMSR